MIKRTREKPVSRNATQQSSEVEISDHKQDEPHEDAEKELIARLKEYDFSSLPVWSLKGTAAWVKVTRVIDGDTLEFGIENFQNGFMQKHVLRIEQIDAPEMRPRKANPLRDLEKLAAEGVRKKLLELVNICDGIVWLVVGPKKDSRGRVLGTIYLDLAQIPQQDFSFIRTKTTSKINLSEILLKYGLVKKYEGDRKKPWTKGELERVIRNLQTDVMLWVV